MRMRRLWLLIQPSIFIVLLLFSITSWAASVQTFQLKNGLKILVKPDHRTAVVVSQLWYKVGGSYEPLGETGISHALEHMMFRGTSRYPNNQFSQLVAAQGGRENAQTSRDYTFYYEEFAANQLPLAFELEADRMQNLRISAADFAKEKQIILEERRLRIDDDPFSLTYEKFAQVACLNAYRNPVIGWVDDIQSLNAAKLKKWYRTWYAPNHATLVVVGDVDPSGVYQLAEKFFGPIPPSQLPALPNRSPQRSGSLKGKEQTVVVKTPAKLPWVLLGYRVPSLVTATPKWHAYALEVTAGILSSGHSARLNKKVVRALQLASEADAHYDLYDRLDGLFLLSAIPEKQTKPAALIKALLSEIKQLQEQRVTQPELTRVKNQVMVSQIYKKDSMFGEAKELGLLETIGLSWKLAEEYGKAIDAVTPEQIQFVAKRYLQPAQLTTGTLVPLTKKE